jgi:hypothetical protein
MLSLYIKLLPSTQHVYQIIRSHFCRVNCAFIWVKIQFRYMFRLSMKSSSGDTFHKLKSLSLLFVYGSITITITNTMI